MLIVNLLGACSSESIRHYSSSIVQYLYSDKIDDIDTSEIPTLSLPLRVGIAFVPDTYGKHHDFTEQDRMNLLANISDYIDRHQFIKSIEIIPSTYFTREDSLAQIHQMFNIDVITLLSYDQTQFTNESLSSIWYWTLIGIYIVPGKKNNTHTMIDALVYDIKSRKILFRTSGTSQIFSKTTPINLPKRLRIDSLEGFMTANEKLVINFDKELELFGERIKQASQDLQIK